ncbi:MAG TPA: PKD domain-containing protein [Flavobacteriales bacterium]|nr:PKD domain-containing protein [Flavobacteriales bacterium]
MKKILPLVIVYLLISSIAHSQLLVYSETYTNGATYCPGNPVYDNWISFRAQLDTINVEFISVTISGDQDPVGRTCTDLTMVKQMAGSLKDGVAGIWTCGAETFAVGTGCSTGCAVVGEDIEFSGNGTLCGCDNPGYTLRPAIGNGNWGGIAGITCGGVTQVMTVTFEFISFCTPTYTNACSSGDYIDGVQFSNISNTSTGCNGNSDNFILYANPPAIIGRGVEYPITLTPSTANPMGFGVWIDYNLDNDYSDAGEFVLAIAPGIVPVTDTITIPLSASIGASRIRVRGIASVTPTAADSCSNATDGETEDYALEIKLLTDVGILQIDSPVTVCGLTGTESIVVTVYNFGAIDQDSIPLAYRVDGGTPILDTLYPTLAAGDTVSFTFSATYDFSVPATYIVDVWSNVTADDDSSNDSSAANVIVHIPIITTYPYFQNFESGDGGWDSKGTNDTWELGAPTNTFISGASSGTNAWVTSLTGNYNSNERSYLVSPCYDFSGMSVDPRLSFEHIFSLPAFGDSGYVEFSTNGGGSWLKIGTASSGGLNWYNQPAGDYWSDNSGLAGVWRTARHELTSLAGQSSVRFRFVMGTNAFTVDEGLGVDDVFIWEPQPDDVGVIILDNPLTGCNLTATERITILVENFGTVSQDTIPVAYSIDAGPAVRDTIYQNIAPGDTAIFSFAVVVDMSTPAVYNVDVWTELPGDVIFFNDSLMGNTVEHFLSITAFPLIEDVESEPVCGTICGVACPLTGLWTNSVTDDIDWTTDEGGTPSGGTGPTVDNTTGTATGNYFYTEASGCNQTEAVLMSPCLDFDSITTPTMTFAYHMFGANMGELYVDIDTANTWTNVFTAIGPQQLVQTDPWIETELDLSMYSGIVRLRIRGITGPGFTSDICIDDLRVYDKPPNDVGVLSIDAPISCGILTATEIITITVKNFGLNAQDTIPVAYRVNGGPVNVDTMFTNLPAGSVASFTFANTEDLSAVGPYIFDAWTAMATDEDINNDSLIGYISNHQQICCIPVYTVLCTSDDYIDGIKFAGISNIGTGCNGNADNYIYYVNDTAQVAMNNTYAISLTPSTIWDQGFGVWIDFNHDGDFEDTDEFVFSSPASIATAMGNITISCRVPLSGNTIMRVRCIFGATPTSANSCDTQTFGETEDYNIFIKAGSALDAGIMDIATPVTSCALSSTEVVTIEVQNFGSDTLYGMDAFYSIDGGTPVMETLSNTMPPATSFIYAFTQTADLSVQATYSIDAWVAMAGDSTTCNDSMTNYQVTNLVPVTSYPAMHDFESNSLCNAVPCGVTCVISGDWYNDNSGDDDADWITDEGGTPNFGTGPMIDVTLGTGIGNYIYTEATFCNNMTANLVSSCLDISALAYPYLEFYYHMFGLDMGSMFVDVYDAGMWTQIDAIIGEQQSAQTDPWIQRSIDLSAYSSSIIQLRIRGVSGVNANSDMAVDDILIIDKPANDVGVISIDAPVDGCLSSGDSITVSIKNFGAVSQDTIEVAYSVNGGVPVQETIYANVDPGDTLSYTFTTLGDFSAPGIHTTDAWTEMTSDSKLANDSTLQDTVNNLSTVADFTVDNIQNCVGGLCTFSDISSNSPFDWYWTFGDGDTSILANPTHIYSAVGVYTVTLTVTNPCNTNMTTKVAYMNIAKGPKLPDCTPVVLDINNDIGIYNVEFNTINNNSGSTMQSYWDYSCFAFTTVQMGSIQTITVETSPTWSENVRAWIDYNNDSVFDDVTELIFSSDNKLGTHTAQLIISGNAVVDTMLRMRVSSDFTGSTPTSCDTLTYGQCEDYGVMILTANIKPDANYNYNITDYCNGVVEFTDFSGFFPTSWSWNFGDGNNGVGDTITHTYASPGTYTVTLIASNVFGSDTSMQTVLIDSVVADFFMPDDTIYQGTTFQFTNTSYGANTWSWSLGQPGTSTVKEPIVIYDSLGSNTIVLIATNSVTGCQDSISYQLEVIELPPVDTTAIQVIEALKTIILTPNPTTGLVTVSYHFTVNSDVVISLYNSIGAALEIDQVSEISNYQHSIDLSPYEKGLYFVKFDVKSNLKENKTVFRKIILE